MMVKETFEEWYWREVYRGKDEAFVIERSGTTWMKPAIADAKKLQFGQKKSSAQPRSLKKE